MDNQYSNNNVNSGNCIPYETTITDVKLARAYVPFQKFCSTYMPIEALRNGTSFPELLSPYNVSTTAIEPSSTNRLEEMS